MLNKPLAVIAQEETKAVSNGSESPVREYRTILNDSGGSYVNRIMVGTASTGLVRMEWVMARFGQAIPMNWSQVLYNQFINSYIPLRYQVADAQNLIVQAAIDGDFEWLLFIEHDVVLPPDALIRFNEYMLAEDTPVVSGLYYVRARPTQPMVFRGQGTAVHLKWKMGDKVWCDGVPTGCLLVHMGLMREVWKDSEPYALPGPEGSPQMVRRVFESPTDLIFDPEDPSIYYSKIGTSDLNWCKRVIDGKYLKKAGWDKIARKKYPFLIDTNIFCRHINPDGEVFP